jgi:hypothetical protein
VVAALRSRTTIHSDPNPGDIAMLSGDAAGFFRCYFESGAVLLKLGALLLSRRGFSGWSDRYVWTAYKQ